MDFMSPWIHTTEKCNLKCHYCYVKGNKVMPEAVYKALGKLLLNSDTKKLHLRFAGGEPLLVFDKWKNFAKEMLQDNRVSVEVLTNLCAVPKEFWKFADLDNVNVSISIDNGKKVKQLNKEIVDKCDKLRNPWIMTTVTKENLNSLDILASFIGMKGYGWCITTDYFEKTMPNWCELSAKILNVLSILKQFKYDFTKISFNNCSINSGFTGCRAGKEMFAVDCEGKIYKCQTLIGTESQIGSVFTKYNPQVNFKKKTSCKTCSISDFCTGWCPLHYKTPHPFCNVIKLFTNEVIKEIKNAV